MPLPLWQLFERNEGFFHAAGHFVRREQAQPLRRRQQPCLHADPVPQDAVLPLPGLHVDAVHVGDGAVVRLGDGLHRQLQHILVGGDGLLVVGGDAGGGAAENRAVAVVPDVGGLPVGDGVADLSVRQGPVRPGPRAVHQNADLIGAAAAVPELFDGDGAAVLLRPGKSRNGSLDCLRRHLHQRQRAGVILCLVRLVAGS